ncbi:Lar family restriction alleviation protein [Burkholderia cepacia]|uniref:Lar family restriction alleviation protein n=1 Tax=Burkholderia cepacia TaxID=292 RepID=UPI001F304B06|nr:Lar family restriction alleviation protein [Burkholderia cepacia]UIY58166.1 Lar family restriction alleviation protein [Burkholderia cepacia]
MSELKPCPFCGGTVLDWAAEAADARTYYGRVECHTCDLVVHSEDCWWSEEDAEIDVKDRWNRRAPASGGEQNADQA